MQKTRPPPSTRQIHQHFNTDKSKATFRNKRSLPVTKSHHAFSNLAHTPLPNQTKPFHSNSRFIAKHSFSTTSPCSTQSNSPMSTLPTIPQFHPDFLQKYDNIIFDMDGVIWHSFQFLDNIPATLNSLQNPLESNKQVFFCTNNSTTHRSAYKPAFDKGKVAFDISRLYTSASTAANFARHTILATPEAHHHPNTTTITGRDGPLSSPSQSVDGAALDSTTTSTTTSNTTTTNKNHENSNTADTNKKVLVIGQHGLIQECKDYGLEPHMLLLSDVTKDCKTMADAKNYTLDHNITTIVAGLQADFNWIHCAITVMYIRERNAQFIATNRDSTFTCSETRQLPGAGSIINFIEASCGKKAETIGKPEKHMIDAIVRDHNIDLSRTLMVGDRLDTDICFGNRWGMDTMLVFSGVNPKDDIAKKYNLVQTACDASSDPTSSPIPLPTYWADDITFLLHNGGVQ